MISDAASLLDAGLRLHLSRGAGVHGCSQNVGRRFFSNNQAFLFLLYSGKMVGKKVLTSFHQDQLGMVCF